MHFEDLPPAPARATAEPEVPFPEVEAPQAAAPVEAAEDVEPFPAEKPRRASRANVQEAIDQVSDIIEALRLSLDDMEEVLELLESLERQTGADERELEALRRQLRQLHRPQERPQSSHLRGRH